MSGGYRTNPASRWVDVTPNDTQNLRPACRGLWVESTGTVSLVGDDGNAVSFTLDAHVIYPLGATRVNSTGTTATGIKALY